MVRPSTTRLRAPIAAQVVTAVAAVWSHHERRDTPSTTVATAATGATAAMRNMSPARRVLAGSAVGLAGVAVEDDEPSEDRWLGSPGPPRSGTAGDPGGREAG